jgi:hypothetical protein
MRGKFLALAEARLQGRTWSRKVSGPTWPRGVSRQVNIAHRLGERSHAYGCMRSAP